MDAQEKSIFGTFLIVILLQHVCSIDVCHCDEQSRKGWGGQLLWNTNFIMFKRRKCFLRVANFSGRCVIKNNVFLLILIGSSGGSSLQVR